MNTSKLLPIVILTAFLCGVVYGYGAALIQRRRNSYRDVMEHCRRYEQAEQGTPPSDDGWIDELEIHLTDRSADA